MRDRVFLLLLAMLISGCGGGRTAQGPPDYLQSAAKAMARGISYYQRGCYDRSIEFLFRAHEQYAAADERAGAAAVLNNIGNVYRARKELSASMLYYDAAAELFAKISEDGGRSRALVNRASVLIEEGRLGEAEKDLAAARSGAKKGGSPNPTWRMIHGILLFRKGEPVAAEQELRRSLKRAGSDEAACVHYALARLLLETGRHAEAEKHAAAALTGDYSQGAVRKTADDLLLLGEIRQRLGRTEGAADAYGRAMKIYALLGDAKNVEESARRMESTGAAALHPVTLHFVEQWLKGDLHSDICR